MSDDQGSPTVASDEADYPQCTSRCVKIVGEDDKGNPISCGKQCAKKATPAHEAYGSHYCSDHG